MKKVLITGANSYIGTSFEKWIKQFPNQYIIDTVDVKDESWKEKSFVDYDAVFHVAGIVHQKETKKNKSLYFEVNRDLTVAIAKKAKAEGVKSFIFLSTMNVFGMNAGAITKDTIPQPKTFYGRSKLEAELLLIELSDSSFKVAIIRPPMVYGQGCKGNYALLLKLAKISPFFPDFPNQRSMIYIDNLSEFVRLAIDNMYTGTFHPQNADYVCTSEMVKQMRTKVFLFHGLNVPMRYISKYFTIFSKVFGSLTYDKAMSDINRQYCVCDFAESIRRSM